MDASSTLVVTLVALAALTALSGLLLPRAPRVQAILVTAFLALALWFAWASNDSASEPSDAHRIAVLLAGVVAVAGGGLVTTQVFTLVDRDARSSVHRAGDVLRGGAWIGALERLAVYAAVLAGWGPGLAIVLAVKGLGRYPELRNQEDTSAAERFIIGTFTSVLWAIACAGVATLTP
jgi:hypothetical protein